MKRSHECVHGRCGCGLNVNCLSVVLAIEMPSMVGLGGQWGIGHGLIWVEALGGEWWVELYSAWWVELGGARWMELGVYW